MPAKANYDLRVMLEMRQRCRTDLLFLCNEVLGYNLVRQDVHGALIDGLQKFRGGVDTVDLQTGRIHYEPYVEMEKLEGDRERLFLYPRGHLKTTILTMSHTIQWLINYPDVRVLISTAIGQQAEQMLKETKAHFQYGEKFRFLFPEFCPAAKKASDFGSQSNFTLPNRKRHAKEPSVSTCSVGHVVTGGHYDVIKNSDLVVPQNSGTPEQVQSVIQHFGYLNPLLERYPTPPHHGWTDVEGTRYDVGDLYGEILKKEARLPKELRTWQCVIKGALKEDGTPLWPHQFSLTELAKIEREMGTYLFSCQYLNKPIPSSSALADAREIVFFPRSLVKEIMPRLRLHVTIDLHGMEQKETNDYTVLTLGGFDTDGRLYILDIRRAHFTPQEVIDQFFKLYLQYPQIIDFKIEKDAHARVLLPFLEREKSKRRLYPTVIPLRRDNRTSKKQRIRHLQAWFKAGILRFVDDLPCRHDLIEEITSFPSENVHDDILDTLADQLQNRDGNVASDVIAQGGTDIPWGKPVAPFGRFMGFDPLGRPQWTDEMPPDENYDKWTGI